MTLNKIPMLRRKDILEIGANDILHIIIRFLSS